MQKKPTTRIFKSLSLNVQQIFLEISQTWIPTLQWALFKNSLKLWDAMKILEFVFTLPPSQKKERRKKKKALENAA